MSVHIAESDLNGLITELYSPSKAAPIKNKQNNENVAE